MRSILVSAPTRNALPLAGAVLVLVLLCCANLRAQDSPGAQQKPAEETPPAPQNIPLAKISVQAQTLVDTLEKLDALAGEDAFLDTIRVGLAALKDTLSVKRDEDVFKSLELLSERSLTDLKSRWTVYRETVQQWEDHLLSASENLGAAVDRLDWFASTWSATRDTARALRAPRALRRQIEGALEAIGVTRNNVNRRFRDILALQEEVGSLAQPLNDDLKRIDARRNELEREIFVLDAPPLWESRAEGPDSANVLGTVSQTWSGVLQTTTVYLTLHFQRALLHLGVSILFFILFLLMRRQVESLSAGEPLPEPLPESVRLMHRPVAASLLVLVFLVRYFYPNPPVGLTDFFLAVVVIPFVLLAFELFQRSMRLTILAVALLYVVHLTRQIIGDDFGSGRLLLLAESFLGAGVILYGLRPGGMFRSPQTMAGRPAVRRLVIVGLCLLIVGAGANVVGSVSLARRLTSGVVMTGTAAIFYAVLVLLADGVLYFAVRAWVTRISRLARRFADFIVRAGMRIVALAGITLWILAALSAFDLQGIVLSWFANALKTEWGVGAVQISVGSLIAFAAVLIGAFVLARVLRLSLEEELFSRVALPRGVPGAIAMVVRYAVVGLGITFAMAALGFDLGKFGLLAGALGVGLGFGLQTVVANFVSGIILTFERPIQTGDMIQMGSLWGTISSIGVRSTRVRSFDGSEVIIPNNDLISKEVTNWTLSDKLRRLAFPVKVEFGSDPRHVIELMLAAVRQHDVPLKEPGPFVIFEGVGEYYLEFTLFFWITTDRYLAGKNEVGIAVLDALKQAGVQIPSTPYRITIDDRRKSGPMP